MDMLEQKAKQLRAKRKFKPRSSTDEWVQKAIAIHGDYYDYSKSVYVSYRDPITIICRVHGAFEQRAGLHTGSRKSGCPKCAVERSRAGGSLGGRRRSPTANPPEDMSEYERERLEGRRVEGRNKVDDSIARAGALVLRAMATKKPADAAEIGGLMATHKKFAALGKGNGA